MKFLVTLAAVILTVNASSKISEWENFKVKHGKIYRNEPEENFRYSIFLNSLMIISEHNAKYEAGEETYFMGINKFSDLTDDEFKIMLGFNGKMPKIDGKIHEFPEDLTVPDSIDWREKGAVLEVKDQGYCAACWAFSATGALEGQNYIVNNKSVSLSEQELLDCSTIYGNSDCNEGGKQTGAFRYVIDHGVEEEGVYPYEAKKLRCRSNYDKKVLRAQGYNVLKPDEEILKKAVGSIGPISVCMYSRPFKHYAGGVFSSIDCKSYNDEQYLDHGLLAVGYGEENGTPYWIIKNSWGKDWGEKGFLRLKRNADQCGIALRNSYPILKV